MIAEDFNKVVTTTLAKCERTLTTKAEEYAGEQDRLHNFKQAGHLQQTTPETALGGMLSKHIVSVFDMIRDVEAGQSHSIEQWDEKLGDAINYLLLLKGLVIERESRWTDTAQFDTLAQYSPKTATDYLVDTRVEVNEELIEENA